MTCIIHLVASYVCALEIKNNNEVLMNISMH